MRKAVKPLVILAILVLVAAAIGARVRQSLHKPKPPPRTVLTHTGDLRVEVQETGTIEPVDKVDVKSKVAGRLLTLPIEEGQYVHTGQLIATVDRTLLDPQIAQTQAQLDSARAHLQQTISAYDLQRVQTRMAIAQAEANLRTSQTHLAAVAAPARPQEVGQQEQAVAKAKIALQDAQRTLERKKNLVAKGFVPQADVDTAQVAVDTAQSSLAAAQQALSLTQAGPRVQDIRDAQAQVQAAKVQLATARQNALQDEVSKSNIAQARANVQQIAETLAQLEVQAHDTTIVSPASGIVLKRYKQTGEIVQSATTGFSDAQSIVATLGNRLLVRVGINEVDIAKVRNGAPVTIQVDAVPGTTFPGTVTEIAPASTNAFPDTSGSSSGSSSISKFSVKVAFQKYDPRLRPGMSANVTILSAQRKNAVLLPLEAIPFTGDRGVVTVLNAAGKQEPRPIVLGLRNDTDAQVISGLKAGEKVVVAPLKGKRRTIDISNGPD